MPATMILERPLQIRNKATHIVDWRGGEPVQDSLTDWSDVAVFFAKSSEPHDDDLATVVLDILHYPAWKRLWDNPEDSVYDQFLLDL